MMQIVLLCVCLTPIVQFQVTPEDSPDTVLSGVSASGVWKQLLDQIASLGVTAKTHASGPEMLGLSNLAVTKAIQVSPTESIHAVDEAGLSSSLSSTLLLSIQSNYRS